MSRARGEDLRVPRVLVDLVLLKTLCNAGRRNTMEAASASPLIIDSRSSPSLPWGAGTASVSKSLAIASLVNRIEAKTMPTDSPASSRSPPTTACEVAIAMHEAAENARVRTEKALVDAKYEASIQRLSEARRLEELTSSSDPALPPTHLTAQHRWQYSETGEHVSSRVEAARGREKEEAEEDSSSSFSSLARVAAEGTRAAYEAIAINNEILRELTASNNL